MNPRIQQLFSLLTTKKVDAYLVFQDVNIRYLTDFPAAESWLLVSVKNAKVFYITDFRYTAEAQKGLKDIEIQQYTTSLAQKTVELCQQLKIKTLGFDGRQISLTAYKFLKKSVGSIFQLVELNGLVESLRIIKSSTEILQIKKALKIHQKMLQWIRHQVKPGGSEQDLLLRLEDFVKTHHVGFSFNPIIAGGPNSAFPHAKVTSRRFKLNDVVLLDTGISLKNGYKSDLTRMIFLGRIPPFVKEICAHVKEAQQRAIQKIKAGALAKEVDFAARNYLAGRNLAQYFGHSLGHGVGLEIHEAPRISEKSSDVLLAGMICTVEPAVYIPNRFGVRLEEMVLVHQKGCEVLSGNID